MEKIKAWIKKHLITIITSFIGSVAIGLLVFFKEPLIASILTIILIILLFLKKYLITIKSIIVGPILFFRKHFIIAISVIVGGLLFVVLLFFLFFEYICFSKNSFLKEYGIKYCAYFALSADDTGWGRMPDSVISQATNDSTPPAEDSASTTKNFASSIKGCHPSIKNCHPPTRNCHLSNKNCSPPTKNCRPSIKNCRPPTKNCRPPAKNCHPSTKNCRPSIKNCRPSTKDCCPPTENFVPATKNITPTKEFKPSIGTLMERLGFIAGGLIALLVALAAFQRAKSSEEIAKAQNRTADEQEKGNFQERYKNTFVQLNNEEASIRLAGFYGLYLLAQDDKDYREIICDVLCGYIRQRTNGIITVPKITTPADSILYKKGYIRKLNQAKNVPYKEKYSKEPDNEIQSIIDLLTNKKDKKSYPFKSEWINFSRAYLVGADFTHSILNGANLREAQMREVKLVKAQLQEAFLSKAQLQGADLHRARLQGANLYSTQLQGANLSDAQLQGASLSKAQLQGAILYKAQLQGAILYKAQLQGAILSFAQSQGADLHRARLQGAILYKAQLQGAILYRVQLQGVNLEEAQMQGAILSDAQLQGAILNKVNLVGAIASKTYSDISAAEQLENRIGKGTDLHLGTAVFSGDITPEDIENLEREIQDTTTHLKDDSLKNFQDRMNRVIQILHDHKSKTDNTTFSPEGYTTISTKNYEKLSKEEQAQEKYIITGILDKATADEIIKELNEIKRKYPNQYPPPLSTYKTI